MYEPVGDTPAIGKRKERWRAENLLSAVGSVAYWMESTGAEVGRCALFVFFRYCICYSHRSDRFLFSVVLVIGYLVTVLLCMVL